MWLVDKLNSYSFVVFFFFNVNYSNILKLAPLLFLYAGISKDSSKVHLEQTEKQLA